jgi:hypothetical protein
MSKLGTSDAGLAARNRSPTVDRIQRSLTSLSAGFVHVCHGQLDCLWGVRNRSQNSFRQGWNRLGKTWSRSEKKPQRNAFLVLNV